MDSRAAALKSGRNDTAFKYPVDPKHRSPKLSIRDGDWKLLMNADGSGAEANDLAKDAKETTDRLAAAPTALKAKLLAWHKTWP